MSKGRRKRWGYPVLVACSLAMGLSLWLHYSVSDAADSYDVVAKKILTAAQKMQKEFRQKNSRFATQVSDVPDAMREQHRGPFIIFLNPGCAGDLSTSQLEGAPPTTPFIGELLETSKAHVGELNALLPPLKHCVGATIGFSIMLAAYERKKDQWDIWTTDETEKNEHPHIAKLPPTRAHQIKRFAIVLLVLGALGLVSLLISRFLDRFYIRREETNVPLED